MQARPKKIVLTGGHAGATAYAFAQGLKKDKDFDWQIFWVGAKTSIEGESGTTFEEKALGPLGVKVFLITAGRIQRRLTRYTIPSLLKIPLGFFEALRVIWKIKPDCVVSFGGFAAFPVVVISWLFGITVIIHEQTLVFGRANAASAFFAKKIALARSESLPYFDKRKALVVGNPVSSEILSISPKEKIGSPPTIFVTGGARGSQDINEAVEEILPVILPHYKVIHQVGFSNEAEYKKIKESLGKMGENYEVTGIMDREKLGESMRQSDIVITRSGANIVSELMVTKRPAILIPIPWTFGDEQTKNAFYAKEFGVGDVLLEKDLKGKSLFKKIKKTFSSWEEIVAKISKKKSPDIGATQRLVNLLKENLV